MSNKCLIIIDMQTGFLEECAEGLGVRIVKYAEQFDKIAVFKYINAEYTACARYMDWTGMCKGDEGTELCPEIAELAKDADRAVVFSKSTYSCATAELQQWLNVNGISEIEIVGVSTTCCVLGSAYALLDMGYNVSVVKDLCAASTVERHEAALKVMETNVPLKVAGVE